jgi:hypothetical protein
MSVCINTLSIRNYSFLYPNLTFQRLLSRAGFQKVLDPFPKYLLLLHAYDSKAMQNLRTFSITAYQVKMIKLLFFMIFVNVNILS